MPPKRRVTKQAQFGALHIKGLPQYERRSNPKTVAFDPETSQQTVRLLSLDHNEGEILDFENMSPRRIIQNIEIAPPILRYFSFKGPSVPNDYLCLNSSAAILEVRNEFRPTELGLNMGDATFTRCFQEAMRASTMYENAPESLRTEAEKQCYLGAPFICDGAETRNGKRLPRLRKAGSNEFPDGFLRTKPYAAQKAFEFLNDKFWHRHLFPFGCYFVSKPPQTSGWKEWTNGRDASLGRIPPAV